MYQLSWPGLFLPNYRNPHTTFRRDAAHIAVVCRCATWHPGILMLLPGVYVTPGWRDAAGMHTGHFPIAVDIDFFRFRVAKYQTIRYTRKLQRISCIFLAGAQSDSFICDYMYIIMI